MAKAFSVLSWNIEHLRGKTPGRIQKIVARLKQENPDVFGLYEIEGKDIYQDLANAMPGYTFHITEGPQTQEILVGARNRFTSFFSQRVAFKAGNSRLRPGALLSIKLDGEDYSLMFLHLKSSPAPIGFGIRDEQMQRVFKLKRKLDQNTTRNGRANFIALGDINSMGLNYRGRKHDIRADDELAKLDLDMKVKSVRMRRLTKTAPNTWSNGSGSRFKPSNLDHVVASDHLEFRTFTNKRPVNEPEDEFIPGKSQVDVRGWVDEGTIGKQDKWINTFSDHSFMFFQVEKVA